MIPVYRALRNAHLGAALFASLLLAIYAASAVQMAYFPGRPEATVATRELVVPADVDVEPRRLALWLMTEHDLRGELMEVDDRRGRLRLRIDRPGTVHRVVFDAGDRTARLETERFGAVWMLNRLHHTAGFGHDDWRLDAWGALVLAASLALLLLAASGLTMWLLRHRAQRGSTALFVLSLAGGLALLVWVRSL